MDNVPPDGTMVKLTLTGNMSTGGISIDRTMEAHPENIEIAEEAARVVGLDIAGIDFIAPDITQPVRETGGGICEVNAAPGFRMHTHPTVGDPQYVAKPVVDMLFPPGTPSRIPIVAVTGTNGKTTTSRMIAHIFKGIGRKVGMTSTDGVVVDERLIIRSDASGPRSAKMVLQNPRVDFAVFEVARGGILREGLGYERNDVAVVLNIAPDHLGLRGIDTVEQLADVKAVLVEAVPRNGHAVLNADDPLVRADIDRLRCRIEVAVGSAVDAHRIFVASAGTVAVRRHGLEGREVESGAEPPPLARQDDRPHRAVLLQRLAGGDEGLEHRRVQGVDLVRAVEPHVGDAPIDRDADPLTHGGSIGGPQAGRAGVAGPSGAGVGERRHSLTQRSHALGHHPVPGPPPPLLADDEARCRQDGEVVADRRL